MLDFYKGKKVFVTGHTGFKGSWLCTMLKTAGAVVTGYALEPSTNPNLFTLAGVADGMNSVIGDIRDYEKLKKAFDDAAPEIVIHMAAQPLVRTSYEEPAYTYETNVMGTVNILERVRNSKCVKSFLNVTTDKVYENTETGRGFTEDDKLDGYDPYSNSKSCSELVTHSYKKSFLDAGGIAVSTARAGNVIGGGDFSDNRIIPDCVKAAISGETVIVRNPDSVRPFQLVTEPLLAYLKILQATYDDPSKAGYFNIGPEDTDCVTVRELVECFCSEWDKGTEWKCVPDGGPHEAGLLRLDCAKIKREMGWKPVTDIREAIASTVRWSKAYAGGENMRDVTEREILMHLPEKD